MTPTLAEILRGNFMSLSTPPSPDMAGEFTAARIGGIALLNALAAQDAERGSAAALTENRAITALLRELDGYAIDIPAATDDLSPTAIDADNAVLRRALVALHEAAERAGDAATDRHILELYAAMAAGRRLQFPGT